MSSYHLIRRFFSSQPKPIITVPKYLEAKIKKHEKQVNREIEEAIIRKETRGDRKTPIVTSKMRPKQNHYFGQIYPLPHSRYEEHVIPLASEGWMKGGKYRGDIISFLPVEAAPFRPQSKAEELNNNFSNLFLTEETISALQKLGYHYPSIVQCQAIPGIMSGENVILSAEAGSGKTIAYLAPIIQLIARDKRRDESRGSIDFKARYPRAIVLVPSRELAEQVGRVALKLATELEIGVSTMVSGGASVSTTGYDLLISTAGIINDLCGIAYKLDKVRHIILDEADTILDDSFNSSVTDMIRRLHGAGKGSAQIVMVGATIPTDVTEILGEFGYKSDSFNIIRGAMNHRVPLHIHHSFHRMHKYDREAALLRLVSSEVDKGQVCIIFSNTTRTSNFLARFLEDNQIPCARLNKTVRGPERQEVFERLHCGDIDVLSCTDIASRGLDTTRVNHVINFEFPHYFSDYLHRAGRTGRMGSKGIGKVTNFIVFKPDVALVQQLERAVRLDKPLEGVDGNVTRQLQKFHDKKYHGVSLGD